MSRESLSTFPGRSQAPFGESDVRDGHASRSMLLAVGVGGSGSTPHSAVGTHWRRWWTYVHLYRRRRTIPPTSLGSRGTSL